MAKMLLATSDTSLYGLLSAGLEGLGHEVIWALDGQDAYLQALSGPPDAVFLDRNLTIHSGLEAARLLRADPEISPSMPIVLLSDEAIDSHECERAGISALLPKSHGQHELQELVSRWPVADHTA